MPVILLLACTKNSPVREAPDGTPDTDDTEDTDRPASTPVRFAVIGDFGSGDSDESAVAALVASWDVDFVITVGDNNYPIGAADTIDVNIGRDWHSYIYPYTGAYGEGAPENRFWACPGNHDWFLGTLQPYTDYFELPGNERYYEKRIGDVHLFCVDSDAHEPDGIDAASVQAQWLQGAVGASDAPWRIVYMHHAPFSSAEHGSSEINQWPYATWGATLVFAGHDHTYERIRQEDAWYLVQGTGGAGLYDLNEPVEGSQVGFDAAHGATRVDVDGEWAVLTSISVDGIVVDQLLTASDRDTGIDETLLPATATWRYLDTGTAPAADWTAVAFDDSAWAEGPAPLGYGDDVTTTVGFGTDEANKHPTTWFRATFEVTDAASIQALQLSAERDDGAVVYLNGTEIWRIGLPEGTVDAATLAGVTQSGGWETRAATTRVRPDGLVEGTNVLAAEVHQASPDSSDLRWAATLNARRSP